MLILLPPSEGTAAAVEGPPLDLSSLSFPAPLVWPDAQLTQLYINMLHQRWQIRSQSAIGIHCII